jgi:hypothetical protein
MSSANQPREGHQVGVTSAQENNPDAVIADLTRQMNTEFQAGRYADAGRIALEITGRSKDELAATFQRHRVTVLHLDHEAFGIYEGQIEPTYDAHVDGHTDDVIAAASEFGRRHAQEMVLIAKKTQEGEDDPNQRLGLTVQLNATITIEEAVEIADAVRACGFKGATFAPKRSGTVAIYHTDNLRISAEEFEICGPRPPPGIGAGISAFDLRCAEIYHPHAKTMKTPRSIDDIMNEMNDLAKAQGRYLGKAFWEVPPQPGSLLDVPETPECSERISRLRAKRLARMQAAAGTAESVDEMEAETSALVQRRLPVEKPEGQE